LKGQLQKALKLLEQDREGTARRLFEALQTIRSNPQVMEAVLEAMRRVTSPHSAGSPDMEGGRKRRTAATGKATRAATKKDVKKSVKQTTSKVKKSTAPPAKKAIAKVVAKAPQKKPSTRAKR
jgi:type IV secretory pathway TrbL component